MKADRRINAMQLLAIAAGILLGESPAVASAAGGAIKLWPTAVVTDTVIRLGDVAELQDFDSETRARLEALILATAPEPGGSRIVPLVALRETLTIAGVNRATVILKGAAECAVRRPAQMPLPAAPTKPAGTSATGAGERPAEPRTLGEAVQAYFDQGLAVEGGRADVSFGRAASGVLDLSGPEFSFRVQRRSGPSLGLVHVEVTVLRDGAEVQRIPLLVEVALVRDVVVARKAINEGAAIRVEDLQIIPRRFTRPESAGLADPGQAIGLRAKRFIPQGEVIDARDLERVPLVRRGQMVEVLSRCGNITVKTAAKAGEDGEYGQTVALHLQGARKEQIVGRVVGPRLAQVGELAPSETKKETVFADGGWR